MEWIRKNLHSLIPMGSEEETMMADSNANNILLKEPYAFKPYTWTILEPKNKANKSIPEGRSGHRIVHFMNSIYAFGGYNPAVDDVDDELWHNNKPMFKELWRFNIDAQIWTKIRLEGDAPTMLASHTAQFMLIQRRPKMVVYGGTSLPFGQNLSIKVHICDLVKYTWDAIEPGEPVGENLPKPLYGQASVAFQDDLFVIGGTSGFRYYMDVHHLDITKRNWNLLTSVPEALDFIQNNAEHPAPRYRHEVVIYNNKIYVFGGGTATECDKFQFIYAFNLHKKSWERIKTIGPFPEERKCHSCVKDDKFVFVMGGLNQDKMFSDAWKLDLESLKWNQMPFDMAQPVYFHSSAIDEEEGKIVTFGGVTNLENNDRTNVVQSCYVKICSLKQMTWEALNHYFDLKNKPMEKLIEQGIPEYRLRSLL